LTGDESLRLNRRSRTMFYLVERPPDRVVRPEEGDATCRSV